MPDIECVPSYTYLINPPIEGYQINVHRNCTCNELRALYNRHLIDRTLPEYDKDYMIKNFRRVSTNWKYNINKCDYKEIVNCYRGGKKRMYYKAMIDLQTGLRKTDAHIKMFVKPDKIPISDIETKPPRAIQYRNPRYNLKLASYLKPFEHEFYGMLGNDGLRVVTKGLNAVELAKLFMEKAALYENPVFIECDHSKFDSTINVDHLKFEHSVYLRTFKSSDLRKLLRMQVYNKGFSRTGIHYTIKGTRMSGDYNTGLGNSLINRAALESWLPLNSSILLDGDDSIIIVERRDFHKLNFEHFAKCGFTTTVAVKSNIEEVEYCRKRIILTGPTMVRDPLRILSNMSLCLRNYGLRGFKKWAYGVMECERLSNPGVPMVRNFPKGAVIKDDEYYRKLEFANKTPMVDVSLVDYANAWGLDHHIMNMLDGHVKQYFGYNHSDIVGLLISLRFLKTSPVEPVFKYVIDTHTIHTERISCRYNSLHTSANTSWHSIGPPIVGYEPHAECSPCHPSPRFHKPP